MTIAEAARHTGGSQSGIRACLKDGLVPHQRDPIRTGFRFIIGPEGIAAIEALMAEGRIKRTAKSKVPATAPTTVGPQAPQKRPDAITLSEQVIGLQRENESLRLRLVHAEELLAAERERRQEAGERATWTGDLLERALAGRLALPPHEPSPASTRPWWRRLLGG